MADDRRLCAHQFPVIAAPAAPVTGEIRGVGREQQRGFSYARLLPRSRCSFYLKMHSALPRQRRPTAGRRLGNSRQIFHTRYICPLLVLHAQADTCGCRATFDDFEFASSQNTVMTGANSRVPFQAAVLAE